MIDINARPDGWPDPTDQSIRLDDPIGDWLLDAKQVDLNGVELEDMGYLHCDPEVTIKADQWAECYLHCDHGMFVGVARGPNMQEALDRAIDKFVAFPHLVPCYLVHHHGCQVPYDTADGCQLPAAHDGEHVTLTAEEHEQWRESLLDQRMTRVEYCEHGVRSALHGYDVSENKRTRLGVHVHLADGERCTPEREGYTWDARVPEVDFLPGAEGIRERVALMLSGE